MPKSIVAKQVGEFAEVLEQRALGVATFTPQEIAHVYIKLDFKDEFERAGSADDAKCFLRSVARASIAAHQIAMQYNGVLLEVQGSTLHVGVRGRRQLGSSAIDNANGFVADLHYALRMIFPDRQKRVRAWCMTVDSGKTLIVAGRGVHGDDSFVSLGNAANRPAKHLYSQLERPEPERDLKWFYVGVRDPLTGKWIHENLDRAKTRSLTEAKAIAENAARAEPKLDFASGWKQVTARTHPIAPAGTPSSPSPDKPSTHFGWVMRSDLDGFTACVQRCLDKNERLQELAQQFYQMMDAAADFVQAHPTELAQLPWAGDNFTAAAVFSTKPPYDHAIPRRLVELALDFEKEMSQAAIDCGTRGWAYGIAGGEVHGNAAGNVYLAGIEIERRRFLVGVGEGFGRSAKAFGDIDPHASEIALYKQDWEKLHTSYKSSFEPAVTVRGAESTLYRKARTDALGRARMRLETIATESVVTLPTGPAVITTKPHSL